MPLGFASITRRVVSPMKTSTMADRAAPAISAAQAERYLGALRKSGLVDMSYLSTVARELKASPEARSSPWQALVDRLLGEQLLTPWQHEQLLKGKSRGFFLGKYKLMDHLGTGGMGTVYLAEHVRMRRKVAIKVLPQKLVESGSNLARFEREARATAAVDHPNIVQVYNFDSDGKVYYMVMQYIDGDDLQEEAA